MKQKENTKTCRIFLMPDKAFFIFSVFYLVMGCFAFFNNYIFLAWVIAGASVMPFLLTDLLILLFLLDRFEVKREIPSSVAQGEIVQVKLLLRRAGALLPYSIKVFDLFPQSMKTGGAFDFPAKLFKTKDSRNNFKESQVLIFEYSLVPEERGAWFFEGTEFLIGSFLRFWRLRVTHENISMGKTYPNFKLMTRGIDLKGNPEKGEVKQIRKRGHGMEFESLRDYIEGDSIRSIDWRATSRNRMLDGSLKLIVRNYQEEQDQQILFIIDSGYRLPDNQFDSALNAMLLLSYVALKHGDSVAAASFGSRDLWIPPGKGMSAYTNLMNGLYDLHSAPVPSSPFSAMENALNHLHRRSFIILISNFREEDGESLSWILPRIKDRHLLLMVSFRESEAEKIAFPAESNKEKSDEEILQTAAAHSYLVNRKRLYRRWEHLGLLVLETSPSKISSALINKYLSVKKSGKL